MDSVVLRRMKQFAQMNKLKKMALMVVGQNLSPDELSGEQCMLCIQSVESHAVYVGCISLDYTL